MLDKIQVYPYQRVAEPSVLKSSRLNRLNHSRPIKWPWRGRELFNEEIVQSCKNMLTAANLIMAGTALIMARAFILEEILPFIFAFLAAFNQGRKERLVIISVFGIVGFATVLQNMDLWGNILTIIVLAGVTNYIKVPDENRWWGVPLITMSVLLVVKTLLTLLGGMSFYREMVILFEAMIAGVLTFVFLVGSDTLRQKKPLLNYSFEDICAFVIVGIGIVMGLNDLHIAGLSISGIICRLGILVAALLWGSGGGTMFGVMAGILPSISSSVFAQSLGMYAISGLLAGLFKVFGRLGIIIGFMLGTMAISLFINEAQTTILGMWETGVASVIFFLLPGSLKEDFPVQALGSIGTRKDYQLSQVDNEIIEAARSRIGYLANVFEELSSSFLDEHELRKHNNQSAYLNYLYDQITRNFCRNCSRYESCWGKDSYITSQEILDIFSIAEAAGEVTYEEFPVEFRRRCIYGREMVNTINYLFETLRLNEYWLDKLEQSRNLVADQLKGVSQVIKKLAEEIDGRTAVDFDLRKKLLLQSRKLGLDIIDMVPLRVGKGYLQIKVIANSCTNGEECETSLAADISSILGEKMEVSSKKCPRFLGQGKCEFTLTRSFSYRISTGAAQIGKEEVCGDNFTVATLKEGKELIVLSDGMGVGERACGESKAAVQLLENLLNSGFDEETAIKTINSVLQLRSGQESFATLDMAIIDLYTAEVNFIKIGSAPTFVKRGRKVGTITSNSLPVGILDSVEVASEKRALYPRDLVVMVSDGVWEVSREADNYRWIEDLLSAIEETDPQTAAEMILNRALAMCRGKPNDDMTVVCSYIDINYPH